MKLPVQLESHEFNTSSSINKQNVLSSLPGSSGRSPGYCSMNEARTSVRYICIYIYMYIYIFFLIGRSFRQLFSTGLSLPQNAWHLSTFFDGVCVFDELLARRSSAERDNSLSNVAFRKRYYFWKFVYRLY